MRGHVGLQHHRVRRRRRHVRRYGAPGDRRRPEAYRGGPPPHRDGRPGRPLAAAAAGHRRCTGAGDGPHAHRRGPGRPRLHRRLRHRVPGTGRTRASLHPRVGGANNPRGRRRHPRRRAHVRDHRAGLHPVGQRHRHERRRLPDRPLAAHPARAGRQHRSARGRRALGTADRHPPEVHLREPRAARVAVPAGGYPDGGRRTLRARLGRPPADVLALGGDRGALPPPRDLDRGFQPHGDRDPRGADRGGPARPPRVHRGLGSLHDARRRNWPISCCRLPPGSRPTTSSACTKCGACSRGARWPRWARRETTAR